MANPTIVDIPHRLGRDEVRQRLKARIGELPAHLPGGLAEVRSSWPELDRMALDVNALGQQVAATLDIRDDCVRATFTLPPLLSFMAGTIAGAVRDKGGQLLLGKRSS